MTRIELFESIRGNTVRALWEACAAQPSAHVEPAYRKEDGELAVDGVWKLPCRLDIIPVHGSGAGQAITMIAKSKQGFDCLDMQLKSATIRLCPFSWDALTLHIAGLDNDQAKAVLVPWFRNWFDEQDDNGITPEGLYGVVHFLSDPESVDGAIEVRIDLGSAPALALERLLYGLSDAGASQIELS